MIIDFHTHLAYSKLYPNKFLSSLFSSNEPHEVQKKQLALIKLFLKDSFGEKMIRQMDFAGIEKSVLLIIDDNEFLGNSEEGIVEKFERHRNILERFPNRFYVFGGFHPNRKNGLELLKKGIEEYGFKGIKLYPPFDFKVNDPSMYDCYRYANDHGLIILSHTGFSMKGLCNEYADPANFLDVVDNYPKAKFVLAHAGYRLKDPVVRELLRKQNVFADIAGFQQASEDDLTMIFNEEYNHKILFGSDWPIANMLKEVYDKGKIGNPKLLDNILYNNAHNLLSR